MRRDRLHWLLPLAVILFVAWSTRFWLWYAPSPSLPPGWYVRLWLPLEVQVGDLVIAEVPPVVRPAIHDVPHPSLLKRVVGLPGMSACWTAEGMRVEHGAGRISWYRRDPAVSAPIEASGCQVLGADDVLLAGDHARSLDSRYIGIMPLHLVRYRVWPLWTWKETP
jgi:type IV secretory pathway protease TraF